MSFLRGPGLPPRPFPPPSAGVAEPVSPLSRTRRPGVPPPVPSSSECEAGTKGHPRSRSKSSPSSSSSSLPSPATTSRGADESGGEALLLILADLACGGGAGEVPFARQCCEELEMPKNQTYLDLNHIVSLRSGHIPAVRPRPRLVSVSCDKQWVEAFDDEKRPS